MREEQVQLLDASTVHASLLGFTMLVFRVGVNEHKTLILAAFQRSQIIEKKIDKSIDLLRPSFPFLGWESWGTSANPGLNDPRHETHIYHSYLSLSQYETPFDAHENKFRRSVWRLLSFKVDTLKMQNRKKDFLNIQVRFFHCS